MLVQSEDDRVGTVLVLKPKNNIWLIEWDCPDCAKRNILKKERFKSASHFGMQILPISV
jgi:hypothetical protein